MTPAAYIPSPLRGVIRRIYAALYSGVSGGSTIVTAAVNGTAFATLTFTSGNASAGYVVTPGAGDTQVNALGFPVNEADTISFTSDGGSADGTIPATFTAVLRRQ